MRIPTVSHEVIISDIMGIAGAHGRNNHPADAQRKLGSRQNPGAVLSDDLDTLVQVVVNGLGLGLKFSYDSAADTRVIQVVEQETGHVVRQIPPEEMVELMRQLRDVNSHFLSFRS
jgi:flagellar protein FlaG